MLRRHNVDEEDDSDDADDDNMTCPDFCMHGLGLLEHAEFLIISTGLFKMDLLLNNMCLIFHGTLHYVTYFLIQSS